MCLAKILVLGFYLKSFNAPPLLPHYKWCFKIGLSVCDHDIPKTVGQIEFKLKLKLLLENCCEKPHYCACLAFS